MAERADALLRLSQGGSVLLHSPENMRYFSGFLGEGALVIGEKTRAIVTDFRYVEAAGRQSPGWQVLSTAANRPESAVIAELVNDLGAPVLWEEDFLSIAAGAKLREAIRLPISGLGGLALALRAVKAEGEEEKMARAEKITEEAFLHILGFLKPGLTEREVALELYHAMLLRGADGLSFPSIVASGENGSLPHAIPSERKLQSGDLVTMDFGCVVDGYCADFTRTIALGRIDEELKTIYQIVLEANLLALDALQEGASGKGVDRLARDYIGKAGYGGRFGHGLGHGVGLQIHENPRLSPSAGDEPLLAGMAVTVEPGIYLPGKGGVRIEDLCILKPGGHRNLCKASKELITL
ncbi:MAG: aminopeptidase P family protein [Christensenellaceae bacterium]|jgi:Xaa-Pro aminopeptidase|nr:aminopeptidase P family protein [Christensenellaceae bacterium]